MRVSEINVYPVKSLAGISLRESIVEDRGLQYDRRFMVVDDDGSLVTQREFAEMATISVKLVENGLKLSRRGFETLTVPSDFEAEERIKVRVWQSFCEALVAPHQINEWFNDVLGARLRLVQMPVSTRRMVNEKFNRGNDLVSFADGYPILMIGEDSLSDLNSKLARKIPMNRFRPNIVVSGSEAFAEDKWRKIRIGDTFFRSTKPCARCVVTTIDQRTGISEVKEPLKTLATYRKSIDVFPTSFQDYGFGKNDVLFGQYLVAENFEEEIGVGDRVEILEESESVVR